MIPPVGTTCLFTFITKFASLDGIYRIKAETTFADSISAGVDYITNLYIPAGLTNADYITDYPSYKSDKIVVLESVIDNTVVYYVPESIFLKVPDPTIREYYRLVMVVDLGVQKNTQVIQPLINQVKDYIQANLGTTNPVNIVTNSQNRVYLTDAQYQQLVDARNANINRLVPLSIQLKQEQDKVTLLSAKLAYYEQLIAEISQS